MISNLASIHPEAKIGANVTVEPFAMIYGDVVIGDGCWIGPHAVIMDGARIGKNCRIFPGAVVSAIPQDLKFAGEVTTAEIGDNTTLRECVTINRGTAAKMKTIVGNNCLLMAYVHVAHDCILGNNVIISNSVNLAGEVEIGNFVVIGGAAAVRQFTRIGEYAFISGYSQVRKDVPPFVRAGREPLCYVGINSVGLRRKNFPNETIYSIQDMYRALYQSDMNHSQALAHIEANIQPSEARDIIVNFIRSSKRGIMRGFSSEVEDD
jgi:UDP-N-acetylglucosamine acyltransferase